MAALFFDEVFGFGHGEGADEVAIDDYALIGGEEEDFHGLHGFGDFEGDAIGVDAEGFTFAVVAHGGDDGDDAFAEEEVEGFGIDAFDAASILVIDAAEDAAGVSDDGVGVSGAEVDGGEALHDFGHDIGGGFDANFQGGIVGDSGAIAIGEGDSAFGGELGDLESGAVDEDDLDAEGAEDGEVEEDIGKIGGADDFSIDGDDEDFVAEARDILEDAAEVRNFH